VAMHLRLENQTTANTLRLETMKRKQQEMEHIQKEETKALEQSMRRLFVCFLFFFVLFLSPTCRLEFFALCVFVFLTLQPMKS
jgi:hypothetical protein